MSIQYEKIDYGGVEFECIRSFTSPEDEGKKKGLIVFLSGAAKREDRTVPIFHRWNWQPSLTSYHTAFISDPTLQLDDNLILGWYTGNEECDYTEILANLVLSWCTSLALELNSVLFVGSSGGGFAALQLATLLPGTMAFVENPQTATTEYLDTEVEEHLRTCFPNGNPTKQKNNSRLNIMRRMNEYEQIPRFVYSQNLRDSFHLDHHYQPFLEYFKLKSVEIPFQQKFLLYYSEKGHNGVRTNKEFLIDIENCFDWSENLGTDNNSMLIDCRDKPEIKLEAKMACKAKKKGPKYGMFTVVYVTENLKNINEDTTRLRLSPSAGWFRYIDAKTSSFSAYGACIVPADVEAVLIRFRGWGEFPLEYNGDLSYSITAV
jgi:pimeloyl-ACP methyl ester carboxylesterase